ncbi:MAG: hypothetical protein ACFFDN_00575 [Candidatus Hodarchaeota archaeon]
MAMKGLGKARHFGDDSAVAIRSTGTLPRKLRRKVKKAKKKIKRND